MELDRKIRLVAEVTAATEAVLVDLRAGKLDAASLKLSKDTLSNALRALTILEGAAYWEAQDERQRARLNRLLPETARPTEEQLRALMAWAHDHGRTWKAALREAWTTGDYGTFEDPAPLQQVRNALGPSWLVRFRLPELPGWAWPRE